MAAREFRYDFFEKIRIQQGYEFVATVQHQEDLIETFFLNLSRKTGIKGLTGIKAKHLQNNWSGSVFHEGIG